MHRNHTNPNDRSNNTSHLVLSLSETKPSSSITKPHVTLQLHPAQDETESEANALQSIHGPLILRLMPVKKVDDLRQENFQTLVMEVMPQLKLPYIILEDTTFKALPEISQRNALKRLCDNVKACLVELQTLQETRLPKLELKKHSKYSFIEHEYVSLKSGQLAFMDAEFMTPEGLSMKAILKKHNIPPNFQAIIAVDPNGKRVLDFSFKLNPSMQKKLFGLFKNHISKADILSDLMSVCVHNGFEKIKHGEAVNSDVNWADHIHTTFPVNDQTNRANNKFHHETIQTSHDLGILLANINDTKHTERMLNKFAHLISCDSQLISVLKALPDSKRMLILEKFAHLSSMCGYLHEYLSLYSTAYQNIFLRILLIRCNDFSWIYRSETEEIDSMMEQLLLLDDYLISHFINTMKNRIDDKTLMQKIIDGAAKREKKLTIDPAPESHESIMRPHSQNHPARASLLDVIYTNLDKEELPDKSFCKLLDTVINTQCMTEVATIIHELLDNAKAATNDHFDFRWHNKSVHKENAEKHLKLLKQCKTILDQHALKVTSQTPNRRLG